MVLLAASGKTATDASTDTSDLAALATEMHVYIPLHISGEGASNLNRGKGTSAAAAAAATGGHASSKPVESCGGTRSSNDVNTSMTTATSEAPSSQPQQQQSLQQQQLQQQQRQQRRRPLIPENFPLAATCSLADLRAQLERLTRSPVFLGFLDPASGGLVELRPKTLAQFAEIPDQAKAIHCRMLRKAQSRSEAILLAASVRKDMAASGTDANASANRTTTTATTMDGSTVDADYDNGSSPSMAAAMKAAPLRRSASATAADRKQLQRELIDRLSSQDVERRALRRAKIENEMYPTEAPAGSGATKRHPQEVRATVDRLTDVSFVKRKREVARERVRQQMVDDGYIVEPSQFAVLSSEPLDATVERFYGRGVQWLRAHAEKVVKVRAEERKLKVCAPSLRNKVELDEWVARRVKPMERDAFAADVEPIRVPMGTSISAAIEARRMARMAPVAKTPEPTTTTTAAPSMNLSSRA